MQATSTPSDLPQAPYRWSKREEDWLREQARDRPFSELAVLFADKFKMDRSVNSLTAKARDLHGPRAVKYYNDNRCWPKEQKDWLLQHATTGKCNWQEVAGAFADAFPTVIPVRSAKALGLKTKKLRAQLADSFLVDDS